MSDHVKMELFPNGTEGWVGRQGFIAARQLEGDEWLVLRPMIYSIRLAVCTEGNAAIEHWCFEDVPRALVAWVIYPQDVGGWTRHVDRNNRQEHPT